LSVSHDYGDGYRSFDLELLASIVPPEERDQYLAFPRGHAASPGLGVD